MFKCCLLGCVQSIWQINFDFVKYIRYVKQTLAASNRYMDNASLSLQLSIFTSNKLFSFLILRVR